MLFIWRGTGIFVPIIFVAAFMFVPMLIDLIAGSDHQIERFHIMIFTAAICSVILAILGYLMNHKYRVVTKSSFSSNVKKSPSHTFFFIPIEYWALIIPIIIYALFRS